MDGSRVFLFKHTRSKPQKSLYITNQIYSQYSKKTEERNFFKIVIEEYRKKKPTIERVKL